MTTPVVEVLRVEGRVNSCAAPASVERLVADVGVAAQIRPVLIGDEDGARRMRFLGSPTIRVAGVDVDPIGTTDGGLGCRLPYPGRQRRIRSAYSAAVGS